MPNKQNNKVGNIEIITFRSDRENSLFWFPLWAIFWGYSTGHVALRLTFNDKRLFDEYVANDPLIPHLIQTDPKTGKKQYQVYVSFWKNKALANTANSSNSILEKHQYDCEESAKGSPIEYNPSLLQRLGLMPIEKIASSRIPVLSNFVYGVVKLPLSIILHSHRLEFAHGVKVREAAEIYARHYSTWRIAVITQKNFEFMNSSAENMSNYEQESAAAKILMMSSEQKLQTLMYPNEELTHDEFIDRLEENFISFGYPERDSATLPLVHTRGKKRSDQGVELEPVLKHIGAIANNPSLFAYGLLGLNCARTSLNVLWEGIKDSSNDHLKESFSLPWYIRWFGLPLTPNLILQQAIVAQKHVQPSMIEEEDETEIDETEEDLRKLVKFNADLKPHLLKFYQPSIQTCDKKQRFEDNRHSIERFLENLLGP